MRATQLRDYRIHAGQLDQFIEEWRAMLLPLRQAHGFEIAGAWIIPDEHRLIWLLVHPGGWDAFVQADEAYFASPEREAMSPDPARLIAEQHNMRLEDVELR